jgi:glutathione S-transferase
MENLEDKFPEPRLRPAGPEAKARVRLLQRIGELQIMTPLVELSRQADPAQRDPSASVWLTRLVRGLSSVQIYLGDDQFAAGAQLTLADCELAPALFMLAKIATAYGKPELLQAYPPIGRYLASSSRHPAIRRVLAEMAPAWEIREPA